MLAKDIEDTEIDDLALEDAEVNESVGSDTLKPMGGSGGGESKSVMLATFSNLLAQLGKEDLSHFLNDTLAQIGKEASSTPSATAPTAHPSAAKGSGAMPAMGMVKLAVKEDIEEMFAGDESLTEDFKERASTLFEAAIEARLVVEMARIQEEAEEILEGEVSTLKEEMTAKIDQYLDYVIEQWVEDNRIALESSLKTDITEDFMGKLHALFTESYISVPEEKIDVLGELTTQVEILEAKLDESINTQLELQAIIDDAHQEATFEEACEGLADTQVEKFRTMAEGVDFNNIETYGRKLNIIKENYFTGKKASVSTGVLIEEADEGFEFETPVRPDMKNYVSAITRTLKA